MAILLDFGGDDLLEVPDILGNTALHLAALQGHMSCVRYVVPTIIYEFISIVTDLLLFFLFFSCLFLLRLLCETAADVSARNNLGQAPYSLGKFFTNFSINTEFYFITISYLLFYFSFS